jgi:hypothetical protein
MGIDGGTGFFKAVAESATNKKHPRIITLGEMYDHAKARQQREIESAGMDCVGIDMSVMGYQFPPGERLGDVHVNHFISYVKPYLQRGLSVMLSADAFTLVPRAKAPCQAKRRRELPPRDTALLDGVVLLRGDEIIPPPALLMTRRNLRSMFFDFLLVGLRDWLEEFAMRPGQFCYVYTTGVCDSAYASPYTSGGGVWLKRAPDVPDIPECHYGEGDMRFRDFARWYEAMFPSNRLLLTTIDSDLVPILIGAMLQRTVLHVGATIVAKTKRQTRIVDVGAVVRELFGNSISETMSFVMLCAMMGTDFADKIPGVTPLKLLSAFLPDPIGAGLISRDSPDSPPAVDAAGYWGLIARLKGCASDDDARKLVGPEPLARTLWNVSYWIGSDDATGGPDPIGHGWHLDDSTGDVVADTKHDAHKKSRRY